jgi:hypothetical protein
MVRQNESAAPPRRRPLKPPLLHGEKPRRPSHGRHNDPPHHDPAKHERAQKEHAPEPIGHCLHDSTPVFRSQCFCLANLSGRAPRPKGRCNATRTKDREPIAQFLPTPQSSASRSRCAFGSLCPAASSDASRHRGRLTEVLPRRYPPRVPVRERVPAAPAGLPDAVGGAFGMPPHRATIPTTGRRRQSGRQPRRTSPFRNST